METLPEASDHLKDILGEATARYAANGQIIGLGSGSTSERAIKAIGDRIKKEGLTIFGIATSNKVEQLAKEVGITTEKLGNRQIDWGFDGADEVEKGTLNLLKGGGGAMTREKSVAKKCPQWIIIVDESKLVNQLGEKFPVPVEVQADQMGRVIENLYEKYQPLDIQTRLKTAGPALGFPPVGAPNVRAAGTLPPASPASANLYFTDFGNPIIDVKVVPGSIKNEWEREWEMIPGVVGTGLFLGGYPDEVWVAYGDARIEKIRGKGKR